MKEIIKALKANPESKPGYTLWVLRDKGKLYVGAGGEKRSSKSCTIKPLTVIPLGTYLRVKRVCYWPKMEDSV